jgi:DNA primase catalytic core
VARIADEVVERLKKEVDLAALLERSGVELKKAGADLIGRCPFHEDDTPSLVVTPSKGLWHCMGACQAGGSAIDWVMKAAGVSFRHAVELLRLGEAPDPAVVGRHRGPSRFRHLPSPVEHGAEDAELLAKVVAYYHGVLTASPAALSYLARRRIDDPEATLRFKLGYADRTLGLRLPAKETRAGAELRGGLQRVGVYRASGHEHLTGCLVVPVVSRDGVVTELYGRKIGANYGKETALHLYLPGPHKGVFNEEALAASDEVILTESLIDALTFWCAGFRAVTASYGTCGFTGDHMAAFKTHKVARVLIAYDRDQAGDVAARNLQRELAAVGIECLRINCPHGSDVNDVAVSSKSPREALARLVRAAAWMGAGEPRARPHASPAPGSFSRAAIPAAGSPPPAVAVRHDELTIELGTAGQGTRHWRVRHIPAGPTPGAMKVNVMVSAGERFHVDTVDLYAARQRQGFVAAAAGELHADPDTLKGEIGTVLLAVEDAQTAATAAAATEAGPPQMSPQMREAALEWLLDPRLTSKVAEAFGVLGVVGEADAALVAWLVATSRLAERPLGAVIQSSSAAGKSTLSEAVLSLLAVEHKAAYSAMTGQALYYLGETDLSHKVLSIAENEGASRAAYALKLLVSEGRLSIAAAGKDPLTGRLVTNTYEVRGPVALLMTTTAAELEPELANRLVVLATNEGRAQTRAVQSAQRQAETLEGLVARARRAEVVSLHHNAQRLLAPVAVVNPHAPGLSFSDAATRHRRDNAKLLGLIRAIALAHQHQRERKTVEVGGRALSYIEASRDDVDLAERLYAKVLSSTTDELAPSTRRLLLAVAGHSTWREGARFTRRELREETGLGDSQLKVHLSRLVDLEYLVQKSAGPATTYELADPLPTPYEGDRPVEVTDRPVEITDRPVEITDRPVIGRSSAPEGKHTPIGQDPDYDSLSAANGRSEATDREPALTSDDTDYEDDRPLPRRFRVVGGPADKGAS